MLDFFSIFSKGGLVLWYFQGVPASFTAPVNALLRSVILQERGGNNAFNHDTLTLKYKLDNQFELVFVVVLGGAVDKSPILSSQPTPIQISSPFFDVKNSQIGSPVKITLQYSPVATGLLQGFICCWTSFSQVGFQKILTLTYVDKLIDDVHREFRDKYRNQFQQNGALGLLNGTFDFRDDFLQLLREAEESGRAQARAPSSMKTFEQSQKSQKTVKSMIEKPGEKGKEKGKENKKNKAPKKEGEL